MEALRVPFAAGALAGALFVLALLFLDLGGLGTLMARDQAGLLPLMMLFFGFAGLFGLAVTASCWAMERPRGHPIALKPVAVRASAAACRPRSPSR